MNDERTTGFWRDRPVALTGATGFVGFQVAKRLVHSGARVTALVRPTSATARLKELDVACITAALDEQAALRLALSRCEIVFHLAGAVDFEGDWERFRRVNVDGTRQVAAAARAAGVRRLIHTSSIVAVGATRRLQFLHETSPWNLASLRIPYITTKRWAEEAALASTAGDLEVVVVNPSCVIGPEDFSGSEFGTLCRRFWKGRLPFHFGGGTNFVDVRDVAAGQLLAAEHGRSGERYLLTGHNRHYGAFFSELARAAGRPIARFRLPESLGGLLAQVTHLNATPTNRGKARSYLTRDQARLLGWYFFFDCGKARRELGYQPRPLQATLADAHAFWIKKRSA